jgi:hypothetical protein
VGWPKLTEGFLKINVDAAYDKNSGTNASGVVNKDDNGSCIAAYD